MSVLESIGRYAFSVKGQKLQFSLFKCIQEMYLKFKFENRTKYFSVQKRSGIEHFNLFNQNNSFNLDLFSTTHTLSSSMLTLNSQCAGVAKEVKIKRVILIIVFFAQFSMHYKVSVGRYPGKYRKGRKIQMCLW